MVVGLGFVTTRSSPVANASVARSDVVNESGFGAMRSTVVAESVVQVKIVSLLDIIRHLRDVTDR